MSPIVTTVANSGARGRVPAPPGGNTPAGYFRLTSSTGTYVLEGDCTATGGGGAMELITLSIVATQPIDLTQFTFVLTH